ncbi:hypothetical protein [Bacillus sp. AK031]
MKKLTWNEKVSLEEVKKWIMKVSDGQEVKGPEQIFRSNDWGITALFHMKSGGGFEEVVFKAAFLPIFHTSPSIYELLSRLDSGSLPHYLAGEIRGDETWMLFEKFEGTLIRDESSLESLIETGETMAVLQKETAEYIHKGLHIPFFSFKELSGILKNFITESADNYQSNWKNESEKLASQYTLKEEDLEAISGENTLNSLCKQVKGILEELASVNIPYSIDHLDLHSNNAVRTADGKVLIFDFEEAVISCPLFSLEKLLDEAGEMVSDYKGMAYKLPWNNAQLRLRDAYFAKLDVQMDHQEFNRVFDLVMAIAPLKYAFQSRFFIKEVGWDQMEPALMAESFIKAVKRMEYLKV